MWRRFVRRTERQEQEFARFVRGLFRRQRDSVLDRLRDAERSHKRDIEDVAKEPFSLAQWIRTFREEARPVLNGVVREAGEQAIEDLLLEMAFDVTEPEVARFLERRAQRFARKVNETTWQMLKDSLVEGIEAGESIKDLQQRVEEIMAGRIRSDSETIARTEVIGASNGGTLAAWRQSDVVVGKTWLAALDERTRETHVAAHGQERKIDEDFEVGAGRGPAPGQIGLPEEDINCRCTMLAVLDVTTAGMKGVIGNGTLSQGILQRPEG